MNLRQAAQQALEALEWGGGTYDRRNAAITALRAALAEPRPIQECYGDCPTNPQTCPNPCNFEGRPKPKQEPVGWQWLDTANYRKKLPVNAIPEHWRPLYTAPTPRKPLTVFEIDAIAEHLDKTTIGWATHEFAAAIEKAHGIGEQHE